MNMPLLSVCIPTYNRAKHLDKLLACLELEPLIHGGEIEVVVSNNFSKDDTQIIIEKYLARFPITYNKWDENIGCIRNILTIPSFAKGDYCLLVGDDDLLVPGALQAALARIKKYPSTDLFAIGYSYTPINQKDNIYNSLINAELMPELQSNYNLGEWDGELDHWGRILSLSGIAANLTAIPSFIFSRQKWINQGKLLLDHISKNCLMDFDGLEAAFPQTIIWNKIAATGKTNLHTKSYTYFFIGEQEWFTEKWSAMLLGFCVDLAKNMREAGAEEQNVRHYLQLIANSSEAFAIIFKGNTYSQKHFKLRRMTRQLGFSKSAWHNISLQFYPSAVPTKQKLRALSTHVIPALICNRENFIAGAPYAAKMLKATMTQALEATLKKIVPSIN